MRQDWLDLVRDEYALHKGGDETGFSRSLIPADTDPDWGERRQYAGLSEIIQW